MYKQDDTAHQNDFAEALLRNTPGTNIHRLAKYAGLAVDELRNGRIMRKHGQQAIEEFSNVINIPEHYDVLGKEALKKFLEIKTEQLSSKSFPLLLRTVLEELSNEQFDDWGEKALRALKHMEKQLPIESLPVLLDALSKWSDKR